MSYISGYIVAATFGDDDERCFRFICERLEASCEGNAFDGIASKVAAHNGKFFPGDVMLFSMNYVAEERFLEAVVDAPWPDPGLEAVQVFACHEDQSLFKEITAWETVDYG